MLGAVATVVNVFTVVTVFTVVNVFTVVTVFTVVIVDRGPWTVDNWFLFRVFRLVKWVVLVLCSADCGPWTVDCGLFLNGYKVTWSRGCVVGWSRGHFPLILAFLE